MIKTIDSLASFVDLEKEYSNILRESMISGTPFYTSRWLKAWWSAFKDEYEFRVFCLYTGNSLKTAIPMMFGRSTFKKIKIKRGYFLGTYWNRLIDIPCHPNTAADWVDSFLDWLLDRKVCNWDLLTLGPFNSIYDNSKALIEGLERKRMAYKIIQKPILYLPLTGTWETFLEQKSKNFRRTIKKKEKLAVEQGHLKYSHVLNPSFSTLQETIFEVSKKSWQGRAEAAISSTKEGQSFYKFLLDGAGEFDIDLAVVYSDTKCVAYLLGLLHHKTYHAFETGFDLAYSEYSPGLLVHFFVLRELFGKNLEEFNFGFGYDYKERFEPMNYDSIRILVFRNPFIFALSNLLDWGKKVFKK